MIVMIFLHVMTMLLKLSRELSVLFSDTIQALQMSVKTISKIFLKLNGEEKKKVAKKTVGVSQRVNREQAKKKKQL